MSTTSTTLTLGDLPRVHAGLRPDAPALVFEGRETSFAALDERSSRVANALRADGVDPGGRVAMLARDSDHAFEAIFGAAKAGCVVQGINWRLATREVRFLLEHSRAEVLVVGAGFEEIAAELAPELPALRHVVALDGVPEASRGDWRAFAAWRNAAPPDDPHLDGDPEAMAVLMYTSGTTGLPKGVMLPHRSFYAVVRSMRAAGDAWIGWSDTDVSLHNIPAFHIGGLWWAVTSLNAGARLVVLDAFSAPRALELIERHRVTKVCMVPAMIQMCLSDPAVKARDLSSLDCVVYGGSPIPKALLEEGMNTLPCRFAQIYGLTETGNTAVCLRPEDHDLTSARVKAAGAPYPGVRLAVVDDEGEPLPPHAVGEICIHSPANMLGYLDRPDATAETLRDGWVHTGDAGYLDEHGFVYVHDRVKDMIIYAGENVYPAEIESVLCEHPAVAEAAVIGVPDERWGELVKAIVVRRPDAAVKPLELVRHCAASLADFKVPKTVDFADALPRTPSGKIVKADLREPFWKGRERRVN